MNIDDLENLNEIRVRAVVYARISSDPEEQRAGVERQQRRGREVAEAHGWEIADTYIDNDASGFTNGGRPGFTALCEAIGRGAVDAVVVQHQDRIARNVTVFRDFADLCRDRDVRLETWAGPIDTASASGRFASTIQAATDEHYSALISEKGRAAAADLAAAGIPNGRRPFGYQRVEIDGVRTYRPDPDEAPVVAEIYTRVAAGESLRSVARDLNDRGLLTTGGSPWRTQRVRYIAVNPLYVGQRVHRGEIVGAGNWPPLIDRDVYERVQWVVGRPGRRTNSGALRTYWLAGGLTLCGKCGEPLRARPLRQTRSYGCEPDPNGSGCGGIRTVAQPFEDHIAAMILETLADPKVIAAVNRFRGVDGSAIAAELTDIDDRRDQLAETFAQGDIDRRQLVAGTRTLDDRARDLRSRLATTETPLDDVMGRDNLEELWDSGTIEWKARIARALIAEIRINPARRGLNYFDPDRVKIVPTVTA